MWLCVGSLPFPLKKVAYYISHNIWVISFDSTQNMLPQIIKGIMQQFLCQGTNWYFQPEYLRKITFRNENRGDQWYLHRDPSDYFSSKMMQFEFHTHKHVRQCAPLFRLLHKKHAKCVYDDTFKYFKEFHRQSYDYNVLHLPKTGNEKFSNDLMILWKISFRNIVAHFINRTSWIFSIFSLFCQKNYWAIQITLVLVKLMTLITPNR